MSHGGSPDPLRAGNLHVPIHSVIGPLLRGHGFDVGFWRRPRFFARSNVVREIHNGGFRSRVPRFICMLSTTREIEFLLGLEDT